MKKRIYGYRQKKRRLQIYELLINFIVTCRQRHACIGYAYPTFRQNKGRGMYQAKLEKDIRCPLEYGLDVFGGRWKSRIICVLAHQGTLRYGILKGEMTNITDAVLAQNLKELIADGIVRRTSFDEIPPRVEYNHTEKGESVVPILQTICRWSGAYHREISGLSIAQCRKCDYTAEKRS